jgi:hypothetical protein
VVGRGTRVNSPAISSIKKCKSRCLLQQHGVIWLLNPRRHEFYVGEGMMTFVSFKIGPGSQFSESIV